MRKKEEKKEAPQKNYEDIEVIIGDESVLNISEVKDCMNAIKPKSSTTKKNTKGVIIPVSKSSKKQPNKSTKK